MLFLPRLFSAKTLQSSVGAAVPAYRGALAVEASDFTEDFSTQKAVTWDSEDYDTDGIHSTSSATSRLTVPTGVKRVRLQGQIVVSGITSGEFLQIDVRKNSFLVYPGNAEQRTEVTTTSSLINVCGPVITVKGGDYFELFFGVEVDTSVTGLAGRSWFSMEIIE